VPTATAKKNAHDRREVQSASRPQKIICDDELLYAVKFAQNEYGDLLKETEPIFTRASE